jgi:hypothetical protein
MPVGRLEERVADWSVDSRIDRPARLMKNIALTGTESRNGYRYTEAALRGAASRYENKPVFLDHAGRREGQAARSTRDLVGSIVNAQFDGSRVRGDIRVLDTESGRTFLALADENVPGVGMSHVVLAQRSVDGTIVEKIEDVISVDVVVSPATTTTFQEGSTDGASEAVVSIVEERDEIADRLVTRLQELIERVEGVLSCTGSAQDGGAAARDEAGGSREAPSPAGLGRDSPNLESLITEAGLPEFAISEVFLESLATADEITCRSLLADRRELLEQAGRRRVRSLDRRDGPRIVDGDSFVRAIRGR